MRALSLPGCACRGAFQFAALARLARRGERFDLVAGASSGSISAATTVAGLSADGPDFVRSLMSTPIFSRRWLKTERSPFGMGAIVREVLARCLPEEMLVGTDAELLVATTHASRYARGLLSNVLGVGQARRPPSNVLGVGQARRPPVRKPDWEREGLVIHSNRSRRNMHEVIVASCFIPVLYAGVARIDGEVHVDGGAADNTMIDALIDRGATDITVVTPYPEGAVSRTVFSPELVPKVPRHVTLRLVYPKRRLRLGRFDFDRELIEEALTIEQEERVVEASEAAGDDARKKSA